MVLALFRTKINTLTTRHASLGTGHRRERSLHRSKCPYVAGRMPWYPLGVERRHIIPAGIHCGIGRIGWHTFRHTFRTLLDETGAPMKVQQELMRHADIRTTMNVYGRAMNESKREAHGKVVRLILPSKVA